MCGLKPVSLLLLGLNLVSQADVLVRTPRLHTLSKEIRALYPFMEEVRFIPTHASAEHLVHARLVVTEPYWGSHSTLPVVTLPFERLSEWRASTEKFAHLLGVKEKLNLPQSKPVFFPARTKVLIEVGSAPLVIAGKLSFLSDALSLQGIEVVGCPRSYCLAHPEQILASKPGSILVLGHYQVASRVRFWRSLGFHVTWTADARLLQPTLAWVTAVQDLGLQLRGRPLLFPFL